jgi:predicted nucleic acid-binding protein
MPLSIPSIVAVDSMTLVWGVRGDRTEGDGADEQRRNANWLLQLFSARKTQVIVAAVSVAEYLTPLASTKHRAAIDVLNQRCLIQPFTSDCAALAAELFSLGKKMRVGGVAGGRAILRADTLIIATARIHGAACLYTNDIQCRELANTIAPDFGRDIPVPPLDIFGNPISE